MCDAVAAVVEIVRDVRVRGPDKGRECVRHFPRLLSLRRYGRTNRRDRVEKVCHCARRGGLDRVNREIFAEISEAITRRHVEQGLETGGEEERGEKREKGARHGVAVAAAAAG